MLNGLNILISQIKMGYGGIDMKIHYISDLHLAFYTKITSDKSTVKYINKLVETNKSLNPSDVLVVAGDVSEYNHQVVVVLKEFAKHYKMVLYVLGNHEYYLTSKNSLRKYKNSQNKINDLKERIYKGSIESQDEYGSTIYLLDNELIEYKGVTIYGSTLWYRLNPTEEVEWKLNSNDSRYIIGNHQDRYLNDLIAYNNIYNKYRKDTTTTPDLIITHIPPIHPPISRYEYSPYYTTLVPSLNGKKWICGHQHCQGTFNRYKVSFYMNPHGYPFENIGSKMIREMSVNE